MSRIHLYIDRVTLEGLGALDGPAVRRAFERELQRLIVAGAAGATWQSAQSGSRDGGSIDVAPRATPSAVGRAIGGAIFDAIAPAASAAPTGGKRDV